jgi:hypothetical protein
MNNENTMLAYGGSEALEARFGLKVAARLSDASRELPHDLSERLKAARELALQRARLARRVEAATSTQAVSAGSVAALLLGGDSRRHWWLKLAAVLPALALVAGFIFIDHARTSAQIKAAAEIDAALLADDAPPAAYSDPGFVEFLKTPRD